MSEPVDAAPSGDEHEEYLAALEELTNVAVAEAALRVSLSVRDGDPGRSTELLTWSAHLGHPVACFGLGMALQDHDPAGAETYFRHAADAGIAEAAYRLGLLLCDRDIEAGLHYLGVAERAGHPEAAAVIRRLDA
jgi:hypothetical protein